MPVKRIVARVGLAPARFPRWSLLLGIALTLVIPRPVLGQEDPAGVSDPQPELLWHQSSALFPIRVYLPTNFDSERAYPAVIALHGFGGSSETFGRIGAAFAKAGFVAALPEGPYRVSSEDPGRHSTWELSTWTEEYGLGPPLTDDPAIETQSASMSVEEFFPSVIDRIREQYRVGPIYVFGFSLGGVYALVSGFHNRDQVDGIIAFGATYYRELFTSRGDRLEDGNRLRIRWVLGRSDPMVPFSNAERAHDAFEEAGYEIVLDEFDGGHTVPDDALIRAVTWLRHVADRHAETARQFQRYAGASASHDLETLAALTADDIVWELGRYRLEGKEAALGPHAYDLGLENTLAFRDIQVDGSAVEYELVERNETILAIGMTEVRHYPRLTFENGLVVRKGPSSKKPPAEYSMAEFNRRMAPLRKWIRETHPEAMSELLDADGAFVFSEKTGASMLRLTREWVAAGTPGRLATQ
jgi:predicted esterase